MADSGVASITIDAPAERIWEVINDVEGMPDRMSAFRHAKVLETDSEGRPSRAEFEVDAKLKVVSYVLDYEYSNSKVSWSLVSGDLHELTGSYELSPADGSVKVTYAYSIDPGFPIPGFLRKQAVRIMVSSALDDLKKAAER